MTPTGSILLPPQPSVLPDLEIAVDDIEACGAQLVAASTQIDDLGTFAAGRARLLDWEGEAADSYRFALARLGRRADAMSLALRGVGRRVQDHADRMASLRTAHTSLDVERRLLVDRIRQLRRDVAGSTPLQAAGLRAEADVLKRRVEGFERDLSLWRSALSEEEISMREAFDSMVRPDQVDAHYGGVSDPADAALENKPAPGATPGAVNQWWRRLSEAEQSALAVAAPGAIGNLAGIPPASRHDANTVALDRDLGDWGSGGDLSGDERAWAQNARAADDAFGRLEEMRDPVTGEPVSPAIYLYDPRTFDGDGAVAMTAGSIESADNLAVVVPGYGTDAHSAGFMADRVGRIYLASRVLDPTQSNATMFWIGYDAPDNLPWEGGWDAAGVVSEQMAQRGGQRLTHMIEGLRAEERNDSAHLTVIGHSYGSTTTGEALGGEGGRDVDDAVLLGSPGVGQDQRHAQDLRLRDGHVWVGTNSRDPIAYLGNEGWADLGSLAGLGLGENPAEDDFGAIRFEAEAERGPHALRDHTRYFDHDSESLENIGHIVNGNHAEVARAERLHDPWWGPVQDPESQREVRPISQTRTTP